MDIYTSPSETKQIHDFNPGFGPEVSPVGSNGFGTRTFWTAAIPDSDVTVHFGAGTAEMRVDNLALGDFGTKANALGKNWQTASDPAVVSFDVVWSGPITRRLSVPNGTLGNHYAGDYVENQATVTWTGTNLKTGFNFTSNPGTRATSSFDGGFVELGHEQNGSFFPSDSSGSSGPSSSVRRAAPGKSVPIFVAFPLQNRSAGGSSNSLDQLSASASAGSSGNPSAGAPVFVAAAKPLLSNGVMPAHVADQLFTNLESGLALNGWVNDLALAHQK